MKRELLSCISLAISILCLAPFKYKFNLDQTRNDDAAVQSNDRSSFFALYWDTTTAAATQGVSTKSNPPAGTYTMHCTELRRSKPIPTSHSIFISNTTTSSATIIRASAYMQWATRYTVIGNTTMTENAAFMYVLYTALHKRLNSLRVIHSLLLSVSERSAAVFLEYSRKQRRRQ